MVSDDSNAISLFVQFYKLLFLGTDFASKMLKIQLEEKKGDGP